MGYDELPGSNSITNKNLWVGWFPDQAHNDIPGELNSESNIGAVDCDSVAWYDGALRKLFGWGSPITGALNGVPSSLYYSQALDDLFGTGGTKIYKNLDVSETDITGAITIATTNVHWADWQFGTDAYVIGVDGTNPPWKNTGTGNCSALAGAPSGRWVIRFQDCIWIANTPTAPSTIYFSNIGDPETWTTDDDYKFDAPIRGVGVLGNMFVAFMDDHIGVMSGTNNRQLTKVDRFINGKGCSGGHTITNTKLQGQEVLVFHSIDGWYAFNGTQTLVKLSAGLQQKYTSVSSSSRFNEARFDKAWACWYPPYNWVLTSMTDGGGSANDFMVIKDMARNFQGDEGIAVPHWPVSSIPASCLAVAKSSSRYQIFFGNNLDNKIYKFDTSVFNRNGVAVDAYWKSKTMDAGESQIVEEVNVLTDEVGSSTLLSVYINANLASGDGNVGTSNLQTSADVLDSTFIMDSSTLEGKDFVFKNVQTTNFGRFFQFKLENSSLSQKMVAYGLNLVFQSLGLETNVGN